MPKLTKRLVEGVQPGSSDTIVWDSILPGFGVRLWPSGRRVYVLQYRTKEGVSRRKTLAACRRELFDHRLRRIVHLAHEQKISNRR